MRFWGGDGGMRAGCEVREEVICLLAVEERFRNR
jgi:hypothetical protein